MAKQNKWDAGSFIHETMSALHPQPNMTLEEKAKALKDLLESDAQKRNQTDSLSAFKNKVRKL